MYKFKASIQIIGINPFVKVPEKILTKIFTDAGRNKSPIPIKGAINDTPYQQTLVRYMGEWRLYINTSMLEQSPRRIGEMVAVSIAFDASDRSISMHPKLKKALAGSAVARKAFKAMSAYRQKEIVRYIAGLKTEASIDKNVAKAIAHLEGKGRFLGRDM